MSLSMHDRSSEVPEGLRARFEHLVVAASARVGLKIGLLAAPGGYLHSTGWMRSARARRPIDLAGRPQPWLTLPAIAFLDKRLRSVETLFEYGSGGSTAWFSERVSRVVSVEHHRAWYEEVLAQLPPGAELHLYETEPPPRFLDLVFRPLGHPTAYAGAVRRLLPNGADVVVVDGIDRLNCIAAAISEAGPRTVIIVDNLEYAKEFGPAVDLLTTNKYRYIEFWGISPSELRESCTAIFYRTLNCLGI